MSVSLPAKQPNLTEHRKPGALSANPLRTDRFNNLYSGVLDWVVSPKTFVNVTTGYLKYRSKTAGGDLYSGIRRTFSGSNICAPGSCQFP